MGTHNFAHTFCLYPLFLPPLLLLNSTPKIFSLLGEILVLCSQRSKQLTVYLYRAFTLFKAISPTFLHFELYHNPEKGRVCILIPILQMEVCLWRAPWELQGQVRTRGFSPLLCSLWKVPRQSSHYSQDRLWPAGESQTCSKSRNSFYVVLGRAPL